jgi:hypothetical protein
MHGTSYNKAVSNFIHAFAPTITMAKVHPMDSKHTVKEYDHREVLVSLE